MLLLCAVAFAVQIAYWMVLCYGFERAQRSAVPEPEAPLPPVSVVVAARDEAAHLPTLLAALTRQTHPDYEVLVVDDASTDATPEIVRAWQHAHANVRLLRLEQPQAPRKKHALAQGIAAATTCWSSPTPTAPRRPAGSRSWRSTTPLPPQTPSSLATARSARRRVCSTAWRGTRRS